MRKSQYPTGKLSNLGWYFEQFEVGQQFETGRRRVTREMIFAFAKLTGDDNPLHTDVDMMRASPSGDVIAHGLLIQALAAGLIAELGIMSGTTIALAETNCRFLKPVLPADEIHAFVSVESTRETSKADRGLLVRRVAILNQRDETVAEATLVALMRKRLKSA